jgi:hypothetical protein
MGQKVGNNEGIPPSFPIFAFPGFYSPAFMGPMTEILHMYSRAPTGSTGTQFHKDTHEYCIRSDTF